jgi:hypothetical protein
VYGAKVVTTRVSRILEGWPGVVLVALDGLDRPGLVYPEVVGAVRAGDLVAVNTTAADLGLGTGGYHLVAARLGELESGGEPAPPPGHLIKWRYTPSQVACLTVEETEHPGARAVREFGGLEGIPVVAAELHSQVPAVAAGLRAAWAGPGAPDSGGPGRDSATRERRLIYIMTDAGALAARFSRLIGAMKEAALIDAVITVGQAFGGDVEAVTLHSGLAAARAYLGADAAIVAMGPGEAGTGTRLGFSGLSQGEALNAAWSLGGRPVAAARISWADPRGRHRGVSHHTLTMMEVSALAPSTLVLPELPAPLAAEVLAALAGLPERHRVAVADGRPALDWLAHKGIRPSTMGRGIEDDRPFFLAAGAAGAYAAGLCAAGLTSAT